MARVLKDNWRTNVSSVSVEHVACDTLLPVNTDSNRTPLLFNVSAVPNHVVDISNLKIHCTFCIEKFEEDSWTAVTLTDANKKICFYNNFGFSLFEDVQLCVNGVLVDDGQREYGRSSYLKNLLFNDGSQSLQTALYFEDNPGQMREVIASSSVNRGEYTRWAMTRSSSNSFIAPVYLDVLQSKGVFPDNVSFTLRFFPARSECCILQSAEEEVKVRVLIKHAELLVPRCKMSVSKPLTIPYQSTKIFTFLNPKSITHFTRSLNVSEIPDKILVGVLSEKEFNGTAKEHCYYFGERNVKRVELHCNGHTYPTQTGIENDKANNDYTQMYHSLFNQLGVRYVPFPIDRIDKGYALYGIALPNDKGKPGHCDIDIVFGAPPEDNLVVYVMCFFSSKFTIDARGNTKISM